MVFFVSEDPVVDRKAVVMEFCYSAIMTLVMSHEDAMGAGAI